MRALIFLLLFSSAHHLFGQGKELQKPFICKGQFASSPGRDLQIVFKGKDGEKITDRIHLDSNGNFYVKTFKVKQPQRALIEHQGNPLVSFFAAPGYYLNISADLKDNRSISKTTKITGIGSESNQYLFLADSIISARKSKINLYELNDSTLLCYVKYDRELKDSIARQVFNKKSTHDQYLGYFAKMVRIDNKFSELYKLLVHANYSIYDNKKSVQFVRTHFDNAVLDKISKDDYLISESYTGLIGGEYLKYLLNIDYQKDSSARDQPIYTLKKVNTTYSGKVKEFVLQKVMLSMIRYSESFKMLNEAKEAFIPYFSNLSNKFYKKTINLKFDEKENQLLKTQIGKPAPIFSLQNNYNEIFSLADFKGKVVYLDLWASWCHPCRAETPFLNALYRKYIDDKRIAFISIAVSDETDKWKKAIAEDNPTWLQLIDRDDFVWKAYVLSKSIPRFILIDKLGNIVTFDAARPSSGKEIEILLNEEIIK